MTISLRLESPEHVIVTERPWLGRLRGQDERVYHAVRDFRDGLWLEIKDDRAHRPVSWRLQLRIERAIAAWLEPQRTA